MRFRMRCGLGRRVERGTVDDVIGIKKRKYEVGFRR